VYSNRVANAQIKFTVSRIFFSCDSATRTEVESETLILGEKNSGKNLHANK
jgi:hypothetical protein